MITRDEFNGRFDDLRNLVTEVRADVKSLVASQANHEARIGFLEAKPQSEPSTTPRSGRWAVMGTGIGATIYAIGQYLLTRLSSGDTK